AAPAPAALLRDGAGGLRPRAVADRRTVPGGGALAQPRARALLPRAALLRGAQALRPRALVHRPRAADPEGGGRRDDLRARWLGRGLGGDDGRHRGGEVPRPRAPALRVGPRRIPVPEVAQGRARRLEAGAAFRMDPS